MDVRTLKEKHELFDFMKDIKSGIESEFYRLKKWSMEDPGTAGDQVEETWANLLRQWIPEKYPIVTKGRLIDSRGRKSGQLDVII